MIAARLSLMALICALAVYAMSGCVLVVKKNYVPEPTSGHGMK